MVFTAGISAIFGCPAAARLGANAEDARVVLQRESPGLDTSHVGFRTRRTLIFLARCNRLLTSR